MSDVLYKFVKESRFFKGKKIEIFGSTFWIDGLHYFKNIQMFYNVTTSPTSHKIFSHWMYYAPSLYISLSLKTGLVWLRVLSKPILSIKLFTLQSMNLMQKAEKLFRNFCFSGTTFTVRIAPSIIAIRNKGTSNKI